MKPVPGWQDDLLTLGAILAFAIIFANRFSIWRELRYHGYRDWPLFPATVQSQSYKETSRRSGRSFVAEVAYSYVINGEYHSGYHKADLFSEEQLNSFLHSFLVDSIINIYVDPRNPDRSVLAG